MGKTYRSVFSGSNSVSYYSPHDIGFARAKKKYSHKQIRKKNKRYDEDSINHNNRYSSQMYMNNHWASQYIGKKGNVPNFQGYDVCLEINKNSKWKNNTPHLERINEAINQSDDQKSIQFLVASRKQIERRGKTGFFCKHS